MRNSSSDINNYGVEVGDTAIITGDVEFNSLAEKTVNHASIDKTPMYSIELSNPKFIRGNNQLHSFMESNLYYKQDSRDSYISFKSKSPNAPRLYDNTNNSKQGIDAREYLFADNKGLMLEKGQQVYIAIKVFPGKAFGNKGLGLQAVKVKDLNNLKINKKNNNPFEGITNSFHN